MCQRKVYHVYENVSLVVKMLDLRCAEGLHSQAVGLADAAGPGGGL
jgi:hypothetical protein